VGCFQGAKPRFKEIGDGLVGGDGTGKGRVRPFSNIGEFLHSPKETKRGRETGRKGWRDKN
jgi:hypothetical protein